MAAAAATAARLYRAQLRTARYFDHNPALKTLLSMPGVPLIAGSTGPARAVAALVSEFIGRPGVYLPGRSLYAFVREKYNEPMVLGEGDDEAERLRERLDTAFNAQRALVFIADAASRLSAAAEHTGLPDAAVRPGATLLEAPALSPGCLLVEHPSLLRPGRGIIFVYDISQNIVEVHGDEQWVVRGYVVNRPFPRSVSTMTRLEGLGRFGDLTVFHGGAGDDRLSVIHAVKGIEGASPVDEEETMFVGGSVAVINARLSAGTASPHDFKAILGSVTLPLIRDPETGGLELADADRYAFVTGSAARDIVLHPPLFDTTGKHRDGAGLGADDAVNGYNYARFWHQNALWRSAVRLLADGMDPTRTDPKWAEVRSFSELHTATCHYIAGALPLRYRFMESLVEVDDDAVGDAVGGSPVAVDSAVSS